MEKQSTHSIQNLSQANKLTILFGIIFAFVLGFVSGSLMSTPLHCSSIASTSETNNGGSPSNCVSSSSLVAISNTNNNNNNNDDREEATTIKPNNENANDKEGSASSGDLLPVMKSLEYRKPALCPAHRRIQPLLTRFIDIDFIEFITTSCPDSSKALVLDIGLFHGGEVARMARQGFSIIGFEPNPVRFGFCKKEIDELKPELRRRVELHNAAVSDQSEPLHFQLAGVDSHAYLVEPGGPTKIKTIVVPSTPIASVFKKHRNFYFVKVDTQGFDTRIVESMLAAIEQYNATAEFIQFEFSPYFEVTRSKRSKEDHKRFFRTLQDAGYDVFMGAAVQPWIKSMRSTYGKTPLSMIAPEFRGIPTCIDDFVEYMHASKNKAIRPGKTSTDFGSWMDLLAVRRSATSPYYRHTGWVLARKM